MFVYTVDPRNGIAGASGASCSTCCCETLTMRPGETNLMAINYAPWAVPIGNGVQLLNQLDISFEPNFDACSSASIDGFAPPVHTFMTYDTTGASDPVTFNLNDDAVQSPDDNTFLYRVKPGEGPRHGSITPLTSGYTPGEFVYTPQAGFGGVDIVWFEMLDAQGRIFTFPVKFQVGAANGVYPPMITAINVDRTQILVNERTFIASFPLYMPPNITQCQTTRMLIRATARDCDGRVFSHYSCFDIRAGKC